MSRVRDLAYLGRFIGLAEAAAELPSCPDAQVRADLIQMAKDYREKEAAELRGDTITNLEALVTERMSS